MSVETWDGKSKYKMQESKEEESERLKHWEKFLHGEDEKKEDKTGGEHGPSESSSECPNEIVNPEKMEET